MVPLTNGSIFLVASPGSPLRERGYVLHQGLTVDFNSLVNFFLFFLFFILEGCILRCAVSLQMSNLIVFKASLLTCKFKWFDQTSGCIRVSEPDVLILSYYIVFIKLSTILWLSFHSGY